MALLNDDEEEGRRAEVPVPLTTVINADLAAPWFVVWPRSRKPEPELVARVDFA